MSTHERQHARMIGLLVQANHAKSLQYQPHSQNYNKSHNSYNQNSNDPSKPKKANNSSSSWPNKNRSTLQCQIYKKMGHKQLNAI